MEIGLIDSDLIDCGTRHPNLALMKVSGYYKNKGCSTKLITTYQNFSETSKNYDQIYLSKVFTKTNIPTGVLENEKVISGGSGLYWDDKDKYLPFDIEHHMPDYNLYHDYVERMKPWTKIKTYYRDYEDKSIGFLTKGCVRQCDFCINKNCKEVKNHSPLKEFYDSTKKHIYLWDDNFLASKDWKSLLEDLKQTNKPFQFRQGLDIRFMTEEKAKALSECKYYGDYIFAFDNIEDKDIVVRNLKMWKTYVKKTTKLYVFCGFDRNNKYDDEFYSKDIIDIFKRIKILMDHECLPYIMRFEKYEQSPYRGMYINLARWCNQPNMFKKTSFREFCIANGEDSATMRYLKYFEQNEKGNIGSYFDMNYDQLKNTK